MAMANIKEISKQDVKDLLDLFAKQDYNPCTKDVKSEKILDTCIDLWKKDYEIEIFNNENGEFCGSYPAQIPIPIAELPLIVDEESISPKSTEKQPKCSEKQSKSASSDELEDENRKEYDDITWKHNISKGNLARCWYRFPVPVILSEGKYISRASTIAATVDVGVKSVYGSFFSKKDHSKDHSKGKGKTVNKNSSESQAAHHKARLNDIEILKMCGVSSIIDFMVEKKKKKLLVNISSSEKVDLLDRYKDFRLFSMPYPGCEFFKKFNDRKLNSEDLYPKWTFQSDCNEAQIKMPLDMSEQLKCDWKNYKEWDVRTLTDRYIRVIIDLLINTNETGLLLHCISGWDRTPLFISLIRIILWSTGDIHRNLSSIEMLYLTLGYDWYLFKHRLNTRLKHGEKIMYFCFEVLEMLTIDNFLGKRIPITSPDSSFELINHSTIENISDEEPSSSPKTTKEKEMWPFASDTNVLPLAEIDEKFDRFTFDDSYYSTASSNDSDIVVDEDEMMRSQISPIFKQEFPPSANRSPGVGELSDQFDVLVTDFDTDYPTELDDSIPMMSSPVPIPGSPGDNYIDPMDLSNSSWNYVSKDASLTGADIIQFLQKQEEFFCNILSSPKRL